MEAITQLLDRTERNEEFERVCRMSQTTLKAYLKTKYDMKEYDGALLHKGSIPILLTAHMDTVHKDVCTEVVYVGGHISSPQGIGGDDRCGIYMIEKILEARLDCWVLFCEDEESGSIGASKWLKHMDAKCLIGTFQYIIELDRANAKDAVFYNLDNAEFEKFVCQEYWKKAYGTCSDISVLAPALECAAVNLSCGYYRAHTVNEYVVLDEMDKSIDEVIKLIQRTTTADWFKWKEKKYRSMNRGYDYNYGYSYGYQALKTNDNFTPKPELKLSVSLNQYGITQGGYSSYTILTAKGNTKAECWFALFTDEPWLSMDCVANCWWE